MEFCFLLVLNMIQSWYAIQTLISVETKLTKEVFLDISSSIWEVSFLLALQEASSGCIINCKAEYIAGVLSACQVVWILNLLYDLKIKVNKPVRLMIDNRSSINFAKNPVLYGRSKHIDTEFHFLPNQIQNRMLEIVHSSTQKQFTDVLTKSIKIEHFIHLRNEIDVVDFN